MCSQWLFQFTKKGVKEYEVHVAWTWLSWKHAA